jgi:TonB-dependent SusC/RagA subfamily outer membrane receptor
MYLSRMLPRILLYGLVFTSAVGCHQRYLASGGLYAPGEPNVTTTRIEDLFAGRFPGVQVQRTGGGALSVRFRGVEPLLVVDGLEGDSHLLLTVRPRDVTRIAVLRDPSDTAIYGNRGLCGVIVITTKNGM